MKQAIVDRNPSVASAALVSAMVSFNKEHDIDFMLVYHSLLNVYSLF